MKLHEIKDNEGAHKRRMRVGRGIGCSKGKTCGRGGKGQTARTGVRIKGFEGGQMPIHRRLPKRGFHSLNQARHAVINLASLQRLVDEKRIDEKETVTREVLQRVGLIRQSDATVKLLAKGRLTTPLTIEVDHASDAAVQVIETLGGKITIASAA